MNIADIREYTSERLGKKESLVIGQALAAIEKKEELTPESVLRSARAKSSPLHGYFTWDEAEAANAYRLQQAAWLIRTVKVNVVIDSGRATTRAFVAVKCDVEKDRRAHYVNVNEALANPDWRAQMLEQALSELESFRRKYEVLGELGGIFRAVEKLREQQLKATGK